MSTFPVKAIAVSCFVAMIAVAAPPIVEQADIVSAPQPDYPRAARLKHMEGRGIYTAHVLADGTVASVEVARTAGYPLLDRSAVTAIQKWRFRAGRARLLTVPLVFTMKLGESVPATPRPNQAMQPTAGRFEAASQFMKTPPLQATLALASGG